MMDGWDGMSVTGWFLMTFLWVALIAAIIWAVAQLFPTRGTTDAANPERPEEILDRRLAHGEIDVATYDELRAKMRAARAERV